MITPLSEPAFINFVASYIIVGHNSWYLYNLADNYVEPSFNPRRPRLDATLKSHSGYTSLLDLAHAQDKSHPRYPIIQRCLPHRLAVRLMS